MNIFCILYTNRNVYFTSRNCRGQCPTNFLLLASVIFASCMRIRKAKGVSLLDNPSGNLEGGGGGGDLFTGLSRASCKKQKPLASTCS